MFNFKIIALSISKGEFHRNKAGRNLSDARAKSTNETGKTKICCINNNMWRRPFWAVPTIANNHKENSFFASITNGFSVFRLPLCSHSFFSSRLPFCQQTVIKL